MEPAMIRMLAEYGILGVSLAVLIIVILRRLTIGDSKFVELHDRLSKMENNQKNMFKQQLASTSLTTEVLLKVCESLLDVEQCTKLRTLYEACCKVSVEDMTHFQGFD